MRASKLCGLCAVIVGIAAAVYYWREGLTLAHYDARAHVVVARRVFDSLTPGWQQVGAVWLPLPHLLNAIPVQIDWFYRTGASGVAISIASMAVAAWAIATLIHRATGSTEGGIVASALLMLNPNVLYLTSTPMTEPLLFGTTFLAVMSIGEWTARVSGRVSTPNSQDPTPKPRLSQAAGWSIVAAVLTRYEAWPIVATAIGLSLLVLLRHGLPLPAALGAVRGLALWPVWAIAAYLVNSKVTVGAWFVSSGFFVPENPALGNPWLAWTQIWDGVALLTGPVLPWMAVASVLILVASAYWRKETATIVLAIALVAAAALPWSAYLQGHPLRVRYGVPLVAAAAALVGCGVALLPRRARAIAGLGVVAIAAWQAPPFQANAPVVIEAQREAPNQKGREAVTAYLVSHWNGQPIMMSMGSLGMYMHDLAKSGFHIRDFLHEGNGEIWVNAAKRPRPFVEWIVIEERAEGGDALHWQATHDRNFLRGYERVAEGGNVGLFRRKR